MEDMIYLKQLLESEQKYLSFLINLGNSENRILREKLLELNKQELKKINEELDKVCKHSIVVSDYVEDHKGNMIKIKYCNNCGLNLR